MIRELKNKTARERAETKAVEIAKLDVSGSFRSQFGHNITIAGVSKIPNGVSVLAKAQGVGFGDGTVEIERFNIYNPPILVSDQGGSIERVSVDRDGVVTTRKFREDPGEAIRQVVAHNIKLVGKDGSRVIKGRVGNTTSTFYPDAHAESTSVDGLVLRDSSSAWSTIRSGAGTGSADSTTPNDVGRIQSDSSGNNWLRFYRSIFGFDTSALPDGDTVTGATLSFYGTGVTDNFSQSVVIDRNVPASATALVSGDFDIGNWDGAEQSSTRITLASWNTSGYNDFTLNSTGTGNINKTGVSWFGGRLSGDLDDSEPTWAASTAATAQASNADEAGTTQDPKLVVTHAEINDNSVFFGCNF